MKLCGPFLLVCVALGGGCSDDDELDPGRDSGSAVADAATACPTTTTGPTIHGGNIKADETWTAAESPHHVTSNVQITDGATLTIEPCVEVLLGDGVRILVTDSAAGAGTLTAEGAAGQEIRFAALGNVTWDSIRVQAPATASLAHATIEDAGDDEVTYDGASLVVFGTGDLPVQRIVHVDTVTITGSVGYGAIVSREGGFTASSSGLTVSGSGARLANFGYPLRVESSSMGALPNGTYTGNGIDEILIMDGNVQDSTTLRDLGVPYMIDSTADLTVLAGTESSGATPPVLTIEAGVEMRFAADARLRVGFNTAEGALQIAGTATDPVVLTSASATPTAGDWSGLWFDQTPGSETNAITHARIEYAGGTAVGSGGCMPAGNTNQTAVAFHFQPASAFITNTAIVQSAGHGIVRSWNSDQPAPSFTEAALNNTFDVTQCTETNPKDNSNTCNGRETCP